MQSTKADYKNCLAMPQTSHPVYRLVVKHTRSVMPSRRYTRKEAKSGNTPFQPDVRAPGISSCAEALPNLLLYLPADIDRVLARLCITTSSQ